MEAIQSLLRQVNFIVTISGPQCFQGNDQLVTDYYSV